MARIDPAEGIRAIKQWQQLRQETNRQDMRTAVRYTLGLLEAAVPGRAVEVRVPPAGAVQVLGGTTHRRGTPPAVIEIDMSAWLELAVGELTWSVAEEQALVDASGERADLSPYLPLLQL